MAEHLKTIEPTVNWDCVWGECDHEDECPTVDRAVCLGCSDEEPDADGYVTLQEWEKAVELGHPGPVPTSADVVADLATVTAAESKAANESLARDFNVWQERTDTRP